MAESHCIEEWRPVKEFEGLYSVSSHGRVRSEDRTVSKPTRWGSVTNHKISGRILKPGTKPNGYMFVGLSVNGLIKYRMIHTLVIEAFIGPRPEGLDVSHEDNDKRNNYISNLRYKTHYENVLDRSKHGVERKGETVPTSFLTDKEILQIRDLSAKGANNHELADRFGVNVGQIRKIIRRSQWKHI